MGLYTGGQAAGILIGGMVAPRHRERPLLIVSFAAAVPPVVVLMLVSPAAVPVLLVICGIAIAWTIPTAIRLGQDIVPHGARWISGMLMGLTWGLVSLTAPPLVGFVCQQWSPRQALLMAVVALIGAVVTGVAIPGQVNLNGLKRR